MRDAEVLFSDAQAITTSSASGATTLSTNIIDLKKALNDLGTEVNHNLNTSGVKLNIRWQTAPTVAANTTLTVKCLTDGALSSSALSTAVTVDTIAVRTMNQSSSTTNVAGTYVFQGDLPVGPWERYAQLSFATTKAVSAGKIDAWLGLEAPTQFDRK